ncbi:MAG: thioredoxin-dependent thiol peroxidase [Hyphomicrobiales bacterium]|nr:MAG: thioredoxin-dependent thiol peroxidase [Hyphomicrobiales bacterium]
MSQPLETGQAAPDFTLPIDNGEAVSLSALKGQNVVLFFYPKDLTSGCTKESIAFSQLKGEFAAANTHIIGISADSVARHAKFREKNDLTVDLASDEERAVIQAYGVWVEKSMYGRKYMGIERATYLIDSEGRIARIWRKVRISGHVEQVLKAAQELNQ